MPTYIIISLGGALIANTNADRIQIENLNAGVYVAVAIMADGSRVSQKIIINN